MVQLADYFTVMMVVSSPQVTSAALKQQLVDKLPELLIDVFDAQVSETRPKRSGQPWLFSITSDDHAGIVYHVCRWLAEQQGNIVQLSSRRLPQEAPKKTLFLLTIEADLPDSTNEETLLADLAQLAKAQQLDIQAHMLETFLL
jgi:glycine cleavage system regulatory protein